MLAPFRNPSFLPACSTLVSNHYCQSGTKVVFSNLQQSPSSQVPSLLPFRPHQPSCDSRRALPLESNSRPFITPHSWPCRPGRSSRRTLPLLGSKSSSQELNFHIQSSNLSKAPGDAQSSDWLWCLLEITPSSVPYIRQVSFQCLLGQRQPTFQHLI